MKRIVRLTENDLTRIVRKVIKEQTGLSKIKDEVLGELDYEYFEDFEDSEDIADALIKALGLRGSNASWIDVAASFVIPIVLAFGDTDSKPGSVPYRNQTSELESEMSKSDDKIEQLLRDDEEEIAEALFIAIAKNPKLYKEVEKLVQQKTGLKGSLIKIVQGDMDVRRTTYKQSIMRSYGIIEKALS